MVFEHRSKTEIFKITSRRHEGVMNVWFDDILGSKDAKTPNPITGAWFRIESGPNGTSATPPQYSYDEVGVVFEGEITLKDQQTGHQQTLRPGDTFAIQRGSIIEFSTKDYGVAWKCGGRALAKL
ncbi:hypothetical protein BDV32DRAFT_153093 [Aspergillus pseudonomiae]|nr:hypothetical protein BDV32DRAFT_153093 [Aspergillus pseudonomiae]